MRVTIVGAGLGLISLLLGGTATRASMAADLRFSAPPPIFIGGRVVHESAVLQRGHVLVPVRGVFEALHADVEYRPPRIVVVRKNGVVIAGLVIDRRHAVVDDRPRNLSVAPIRLGGRVYVPLRLVAEMLGATVTYSSDPPLVNITVPSEILSDEPPLIVGSPPVDDASPPLWALVLVGVCALGLVVELARRVAIVTRMKRSRVTRLPRFRNLVAARRLRR